MGVKEKQCLKSARCFWWNTALSRWNAWSCWEEVLGEDPHRPLSEIFDTEWENLRITLIFSNLEIYRTWYFQTYFTHFVLLTSVVYSMNLQPCKKHHEKISFFKQIYKDCCLYDIFPSRRGSFPSISLLYFTIQHCIMVFHAHLRSWCKVLRTKSGVWEVLAVLAPGTTIAAPATISIYSHCYPMWNVTLAVFDYF